MKIVNLENSLNPNPHTPKVLIKEGIFDSKLTEVEGYNTVLVLCTSTKFDLMFPLASGSPLTPLDLHYSLKYHPNGVLVVIAYKKAIYLFSPRLEQPSDSTLSDVFSELKSQPTLADTRDVPDELGFTKPVYDEVDYIEKQLTQVDERVLSLQRQLVTEVSELRVLKDKLAVAKENNGKALKVHISHEMVESYSVVMNKLYIKYKEIVATADEIDYPGYIGRMLVVVDLQNLRSDNMTPNIRFYNLDRVEYGMSSIVLPHPHVVLDELSGVATVACLGNYLDPLNNAIVDREFELLAELLYRLLSTVNLEEQDEAARFFPSWKNKVVYTKQNDLWKAKEEDNE